MLGFCCRRVLNVARAQRSTLLTTCRKGSYTDVVPPTPLYLPREQLEKVQLEPHDAYLVLPRQNNAVAAALRRLLRCALLTG